MDNLQTARSITLETIAFLIPSDSHPFALIGGQSVPAETDDSLLQRRNKVAKVHVSHTACSDVPIFCAMLNRYKSWGIADRANLPRDVRKEELTKDLAFLAEIVRVGKATMGDGPIVRPSKAMRAIELRANPLARFPEVSDEVARRHRQELEVMARAVLSVVTDYQPADTLACIDRAFQEINK